MSTLNPLLLFCHTEFRRRFEAVVDAERELLAQLTALAREVRRVPNVPDEVLADLARGITEDADASLHRYVRLSERYLEAHGRERAPIEPPPIEPTRRVRK